MVDARLWYVGRLSDGIDTIMVDDDMFAFDPLTLDSYTQ